MVNDKKKTPNPFQYRTTLHLFPFAMTIATDWSRVDFEKSYWENIR